MHISRDRSIVTLPPRVQTLRGTLFWSLAVGLCSIAMRLTFAMAYASHSIGRLPWVDEGSYGERALAILGGSWMPSSPFFQDPLYPYLLAGLMRVVGTSIGTLRIASALVGALTPLVVFEAARRGFGLAEAVVAGLLTAAYGPLIFADASLGKEGPAALLAATGLLFLAYMRESSVRVRTATFAGRAGLCWGLVALLRSNALLIGPLGAVLFLRSDRPGRFVVFTAFLGGFAIALLPVIAVNRFVSQSHEWIVTTWQFGPNFYIGNGPEATGSYVAPEFVEPNPAREAEDFAAEARRRSGKTLTYHEISSYWFYQGVNRWEAAPAESLALLAKKVGLVLHGTEIPDNQDPDFVRIVASPGLGWLEFGFGILGPIAALGVPTAVRRPFGRWLVITTFAGLGSTALFFVVGRYRVPWVPGLAILGGVGTVELARLFRRRDVRKAALLFALTALPSLILAWRPIADPAPERWGHSLISLALAEMNEHRCESAIDALDDTRALGGGPASRVERLLSEGPVHDRMGELVRLRLQSRLPENPSSLNRSRWLRQLPEGRAESRRLLDELLRLNGNDPAVIRESAAWRLGESADPKTRSLAIDELNRARKGARIDPAAAILLSLATWNPAYLNSVVLRSKDPLTTRFRVAHAVVSRRDRISLASPIMHP